MKMEKLVKQLESVRPFLKMAQNPNEFARFAQGAPQKLVEDLMKISTLMKARMQRYVAQNTASGPKNTTVRALYLSAFEKFTQGDTRALLALFKADKYLARPFIKFYKTLETANSAYINQQVVNHLMDDFALIGDDIDPMDNLVTNHLKERGRAIIHSEFPEIFDDYAPAKSDVIPLNEPEKPKSSSLWKVLGY